MEPYDSTPSISKQYQLLLSTLKGYKGYLSTEKLDAIVEWLREYGPRDISEAERKELRRLLLERSGLGERELANRLGEPGQPTESGGVSSLSSLLPHTGWFGDYLEYVQDSEPPIAFHFFSAATAFSAAMGRRVWVERGQYRTYPGLAVVLTAPTGRVRKTSSANVAISLLRESEASLVLSDKVTPEALVEGLNREGDDATGLIYAPEFAVFLGRQKYNEGMVPLLTSLFDAPNVWASTTIMRGACTLRNVCLSLLGCSTPDWLVSAIPRDAFGGGFMSRLLFIVQDAPEKLVPRPSLPPYTLRQRLVEGLQIATQYSGEVGFEPGAGEWFDDWYIKHKSTPPINERFAGYYERKPDHLLRLSMVLEASHFRKPLKLRIAGLEQSLAILNWTEAFLPETFERLDQTPTAAEAELIVSVLRRLGGRAVHSTLLRRVSGKMNARLFAEHIRTLRESGRVVEHHNPIEHFYVLKEDHVD